MPIINLRKYYYPTIPKDAFVEVSGEVAEALEEGLRIERRQERKKLYHKVFSMDTNDWTQLHIPIYEQVKHFNGTIYTMQIRDINYLRAPS